jgi:hypothetical protein
MQQLADRAASLLMSQLKKTDIAAHCLDTYGPGVFYQSFVASDDVAQFVAAPHVNKSVYHTHDRAAMCGDYAVGVLQTRPTSLIVVIDVFAERLRATLVDGRRAAMIEPDMEFREIRVDAVAGTPPQLTAAENRKCDEVAEQLREFCRREQPRRVVFYYDGVADDGEFTVVDEDAFSSTATLFTSIATMPRSLEHVRELCRTHDPTTHAVLWMKVRSDVDVACVVERFRAETPALPAAT